MHGQIGYHQQIPVQIHQTHIHPAVRPAHCHAARHGQGPVKPCGQNHASVILHIQPHIASLRHRLRPGLYLKSGRIAMGRHYMIAFKGTALTPLPGSRQPKHDQRGIVAGHIIRPARRKLPAVLLPQLRKTGLLQPLFHIVRHMKHAGTVLNKFQQPPVILLLRLSFHMPLSPYIFHFILYSSNNLKLPCHRIKTDFCFILIDQFHRQPRELYDLFSQKHFCCIKLEVSYISPHLSAHLTFPQIGIYSILTFTSSVST